MMYSLETRRGGKKFFAYYYTLVDLMVAYREKVAAGYVCVMKKYKSRFSAGKTINASDFHLRDN